MHEAFTKLRVLAVILSAAAAIVVGVAHIRIVKDVYPVRTKVVHVAVPTLKKPVKAEMTDDQCMALKKGESKQKLQAQYGVPKDELLGWPIKGTDSERYCSPTFGYEEKIIGVTMSLPL